MYASWDPDSNNFTFSKAKAVDAAERYFPVHVSCVAGGTLTPTRTTHDTFFIQNGDLLQEGVSGARKTALGKMIETMLGRKRYGHTCRECRRPHKQIARVESRVNGVLKSLLLIFCCEKPRCAQKVMSDQKKYESQVGAGTMKDFCGLCLMSGPPVQCSRCRKAKFCGKVCFSQAWPEHKKVCRPS